MRARAMFCACQKLRIATPSASLRSSAMPRASISYCGRGTLPLTLFGPVRFPRLMGKLAFPSLIVQALAPSAGALLLEAKGASVTLGVLTGFALTNVVLIGLLWWLCRKP